jgi:hypothetical protein
MFALDEFTCAESSVVTLPHGGSRGGRVGGGGGCGRCTKAEAAGGGHDRLGGGSGRCEPWHSLVGVCRQGWWRCVDPPDSPTVCLIRVWIAGK